LAEISELNGGQCPADIRNKMAYANANVNADLEKAKAEVGKKIDEGIGIDHSK
jgi:hypothetical protein